ncbi:hypothetical protein SAMN06265365_103383 [Tistlia consotensis]|uniref:DUF1489 domain-containing protein n=1 Tax=Tistlia consotensis USBA 355 TaxID=560819 RepID=A0A1Y6CAK4_9PROT|nr:DUF1489 domain-containing protein [Tistlia consotensis]SMF44679.1 hypothetical protein SAMN05428998_115145 [Tistlia consotensis USBA 355]SNR43440.1 hypothetical protein SAMN06265365_103383 [Tistlia consotensis]
MTLHLIKLSVGSESADSLDAWQQERFAAHGRLWHATRMQPRRGEELLDGGSIYWVIKGVVQARQPLVGLESDVDEEGRGFTRLMLRPGLVRVLPRAHRPFQGWRYLRPEDAPGDLPSGGGQGGDLPPALAAELRELGIL